MSGNYWDAFRTLLSQIAHEDDLLAARTLSLILSQFLLLLCYFLIDVNKLPRRPNFNYFKFIGMIGILSTIFIYSAILAAELEFVELRTRAIQISIEHPDLPFRTLPNIGIGSGLLCPMLLALLSLYFWILLTTKSNTAAALAVLSGALSGVFVIGKAHEVLSGGVAATLIGASLPIAMAFLAVAVVVGIRSHRLSS